VRVWLTGCYLIGSIVHQGCADQTEMSALDGSEASESAQGGHVLFRALQTSLRSQGKQISATIVVGFAHRTPLPSGDGTSQRNETLWLHERRIRIRRLGSAVNQPTKHLPDLVMDCRPLQQPQNRRGPSRRARLGHPQTMTLPAQARSAAKANTTSMVRKSSAASTDRSRRVGQRRIQFSSSVSRPTNCLASVEMMFTTRE
jgi:hypothetical protein